MDKLFLYFGASSAATLVHYAVYYFLLSIMPAVPASLIASIAGAMQAFALNKNHVFKPQANRCLSLHRFLIVAGLSCFINLVLMWILVANIAVGPWASQIMASLGTFLCGYILNLNWSYSQLSGKRSYE